MFHCRVDVMKSKKYAGRDLSLKVNYLPKDKIWTKLTAFADNKINELCSGQRELNASL